MSNTFKSVKNRFFKTSIHIVDRYHFIRQVSWALENVRKRIQKIFLLSLESILREVGVYLQNLLNLTTEQAKEVSLMLDLNNDLKLAYRLKELFYQYVLSQPIELEHLNL
nr:transposase [Peptoniphilus porci]